MYKPVWDKHFSLLQKAVNYGCKKFYNIGPWLELEAINCKQITRWQHVSRLKASSFCSW
jgi:hypothetical protein